MAHVAFNQLLPEVAKKETRSIILPAINQFGIPAGTYVFLELYCDDLSCDCRNVYIYVLNAQTNTTEATITYGWERLKFYMDWMGIDDKNDQMIKDFKGPALYAFGEQRSHANKWLTIFKDILKSDKDYANRLQRHYQLVKASIEHKNK